MKLVKWMMIGSAVVLMSTAALAQENRSERAEVRFLEGMIDHHQMALDMANDCLAKADSSTVLTLCDDIIEAQSAEITTMQGWLLDWYNIQYAPVSMLATEPDDAHTGHEMSGMNMPFTDPPMTMGMMAGLNRLEGRAYDVAWLESMIDHHDDALHMAARILEQVQHDALRELADGIIEAQTAEIEMMEALLVTLGE